ncbi:MAG: hypothetical protein IVW51_08600 [Thermaceae bacterium]|nr:hypothetical protein [Thermaceae bacterium]
MFEPPRWRANDPAELATKLALGSIAARLYSTELLRTLSRLKAVGNLRGVGLTSKFTNPALSRFSTLQPSKSLSTLFDSSALQRLTGSKAYERYFGTAHLAGFTALGPMTRAFTHADLASPRYLERIAAHLLEAVEVGSENLEPRSERGNSLECPPPVPLVEFLGHPCDVHAAITPKQGQRQADHPRGVRQGRLFALPAETTL